MEPGLFPRSAEEALCKKPFKVCSKVIHIFGRGLRYTITVERNWNVPGRQPLITPISPFFHLFFYPLFESNGCARLPFPPWRPGVSRLLEALERTAKNLSQPVQNLFTHSAAKRGILNTSAREAAIPKLTAYRSFYFSFTPFFESV